MSDFDLGYRDPIWSRLEDKEAEIERLTKEVQAYAKIIKDFDSWKSLLTRAANALELLTPGSIVPREEYLRALSESPELIQHLREAAK